MKRLGYIFVLLVALGAWIQTGTPSERANYMTEFLLKPDLQLQDSQLEKVEQAYIDYYTKMDQARSSGESLTTIRGLMANRMKEMKDILNDDQYQKYQANQKVYQQKMQEKFGG